MIKIRLKLSYPIRTPYTSMREMMTRERTFRSLMMLRFRLKDLRLSTSEERVYNRSSKGEVLTLRKLKAVLMK